MKSLLGAFKQPSFLICAAVLAIAASLKTYAIQKLGYELVKYPLDLKRPLGEMDETSLAPYLVIKKSEIANREILESLGTEEYLQWQLEDPDLPKEDPVKYCSLFITYYTGNPDMVPHVPDECYVGGGNRLERKDLIRIPLEPSAQHLPGLKAPGSEIGVQYLMFSRPGRGMIPMDEKFSVQYFFKANGQYSESRTETRRILGQNFFSKYSYFCKVEWSFHGIGTFNSPVYPDKLQTIQASEKLLSVLLPVLELDHWPDWEEANRTAKTQPEGANRNLYN